MMYNDTWKQIPSAHNPTVKKPKLGIGKRWSFLLPKKEKLLSEQQAQENAEQAQQAGEQATQQ